MEVSCNVVPIKTSKIFYSFLSIMRNLITLVVRISGGVLRGKGLALHNLEQPGNGNKELS